MSIGSRAKAFSETADAKTRPSFITDEHLQFLDDLRESGDTSMFGARPYIQREYSNLTEEQAASVLSYWMKKFGERKKASGGN